MPWRHPTLGAISEDLGPQTADTLGEGGRQQWQHPIFQQRRLSHCETCPSWPKDPREGTDGPCQSMLVIRGQRQGRVHSRVYVCTHVQAHGYRCAHTHINTCAHVHNTLAPTVQMHTHMHTPAYICTGTSTCTHACVHAYTRTSTYILAAHIQHMHMHTHARHTLMHTDVWLQTHMHVCPNTQMQAHTGTHIYTYACTCAHTNTYTLACTCAGTLIYTHTCSHTSRGCSCHRGQKRPSSCSPETTEFPLISYRVRLCFLLMF